MSLARHRGQFIPEPLAAKVPEITFLFWVVKILTTCGGEVAYLAITRRDVQPPQARPAGPRMDPHMVPGRAARRDY